MRMVVSVGSRYLSELDSICGRSHGKFGRVPGEDYITSDTSFEKRLNFGDSRNSLGLNPVRPESMSVQQIPQASKSENLNVVDVTV